MRGAIPPLPQHTLMAWCSVKKWTTLPLPFTLPGSFDKRRTKYQRLCVTTFGSL